MPNKSENSPEGLSSGHKVLIRLYRCPACGVKYWPDPDRKWDMVCPKDNTICRPVLEADTAVSDMELKDD